MSETLVNAENIADSFTIKLLPALLMVSRNSFDAFLTFWTYNWVYFGADVFQSHRSRKPCGFVGKFIFALDVRLQSNVSVWGKDGGGE